MASHKDDLGQRRVVITPEFLEMAVKQIDSGLEIPDDARLLGITHVEESWSYSILFESESWYGGNREAEYIPRVGEELGGEYDDNATDGDSIEEELFDDLENDLFDASGKHE